MQIFLVIAVLFVEANGQVALADSRPIDFDTQILPILTKSGCNAGSCHGAAAGRGGFQLSLYGSRPAQDFDEITRAFEGRRINHRDAVLSLLLMKPIEQVSHEGGTRIDRDGGDFTLIRRWIASGAKRQHLRELKDFSVSCGDSKPNLGESVRLSSVASFTDGMEEDVLRWTVLKPNDPSAVAVSPEGLLTVKRPGRHIVVARYLNQVASLELLVPANHSLGKRMRPEKMRSIDDFINAGIGELGLVAAPASSDGEFIRRLSLDLTGRLPAPELVTAFVADPSPDKRSVQVDAFLKAEEFTEFWTHHLAQLFRVGARRGSAESAEAYYAWLRRCVADDVSFKQMAREMILSEGSVTVNAPANFYAVVNDARAQAEFLSEAFLGVRLQCANCHDHPLDAWTQDDYHGLAAIFAGIKRGPVIRVSTSGAVIHPATGEPAIPRIPGGSVLPVAEDSRVILADWLTSESNPYFAKAIVNRIWSHMMGRGLVEPVDDLRVTNPPTHPALLKWLVQDFTDHGYRLRHTIRQISLSAVYSRSSHLSDVQPVLQDFYAVAAGKPLTAAMLMDAVSDVTGVPEQLGNSEPRAVSLAGLTEKSEALDLLGRCQSDTCSTESGSVGRLPVQLHLINGELLNIRLSSAESGVMQAIAAGDTSEEIVDEFYLRSYSRLPTAEERSFWEQQFSFAENRQQFAEIAQDFLWSLLNSEEFRSNR